MSRIVFDVMVASDIDDVHGAAPLGNAQQLIGEDYSFQSRLQTTKKLMDMGIPRLPQHFLGSFHQPEVSCRAGL